MGTYAWDYTEEFQSHFFEDFYKTLDNEMSNLQITNRKFFFKIFHLSVAICGHKETFSSNKIVVRL